MDGRGLCGAAEARTVAEDDAGPVVYDEADAIWRYPGPARRRVWDGAAAFSQYG